MLPQKINITTIGGGTGTFNVLTGLREYKNLNIAAIVSMSDSGGSTGVLRDEFGVLPPGDVRRAILALSEESNVLRKLFEYRFDKTSSVSGHTVGNLLLTAMADITHDFEKGVEEVSRLFHVTGKVIPVTKEKNDLCVILEDGQKIIGETHIDVPLHDPNLIIKDAFLTPEVTINPTAKGALENSDVIVICPGDLYTSIIPNLLVKGVKETIKKNKSEVVFVCNIMTKVGETTHFEISDFINVIERYLGENIITTVIVNNGFISDEMVEKYKSEFKKPLKLKHPEEFEGKPYRIVEQDLLNENDFVRHSPQKLARVLYDIVEGWVK